MHVEMTGNTRENSCCVVEESFDINKEFWIEWKLLREDLYQGMVSCVIRHEVYWSENSLCRETLSLAHTSGCQEERERERESFDFAVPFYILFSSSYLAAIRSTNREARDVIPSRLNQLYNVINNIF